MKRTTARSQARRKSEPVDTRIDCRVSKRFKKEWAMVAQKMGMSFTAFLIASLNESVNRYKQETFNIIHLSFDEQKKFFDSLTNPPEPNAALIQGFKDHNKMAGL